jgi:hypothetical protein
MEFHVYHDFMVYTKGVAYILMAVTLGVALGWWMFLTGKEPKDDNHH